MELSSEIGGFLNILTQSLKLFVSRNAILIALSSTLCILVTSIVLLVLSFSHEIATKLMMKDSVVFFVISYTLLLAAGFTLVFSYIATAHVLGLATVTATAASYTNGDGGLSFPDLVSRIRTKWRFRKNNNIRGHFAVMAIAMVLFYAINPVTVAVGVSILVYYLHASVASEVAAVVLVVEDGCEAAEAVERAEKLVEGSRAQGVMVNVLVSIVGLVLLLGLCHSLNITLLLFSLNCAALLRIFLSVAYTVYYFRCKDYHAHHIDVIDF